MRKLAVYCRISRDRENQKSITVQKEMGKQFAKLKDYEPVYYIDKGISGGGDSSKRPAYTKMMKDIKSRDIDAVYVYNQDRLMREEMEWFTLMEILLTNDVTLYEDGRRVDLEDESSRMMGAFKSIMDASFRRTTSKKIKASILHNLKEGRVTGITAYGYKSGKDNMLEVDEEEAEVVRLIFKLAKKGLGQISIANELNKRNIPTRYNKIGGEFEVVNKWTGEKTVHKKDAVRWNSSSLQCILTNKNYIGERIYGGVSYKCPPIIEPKLFRQVHEAMQARKTGKKSDYRHLLNGLLFCGVCGKRLTGRGLLNKVDTYRCVDKRYANSVKKPCKSRDCQSRALDALIWDVLFINGTLQDAVNEELQRDDTLDELEKWEDTLSDIKKNIRSIKRRREKVIDLVIDEVITREQSSSRMESLDKEQQLQEEAMHNAEKMVDYTKEKIEKGDKVSFDLVKAKDKTPFDEKQELIRRYIKSITVEYVEKVYYIKVEFHLDIDWLLFAMDTKYNVAVDGKSNTVIPLSDKYKELLRQGVADDHLITKLVMAVMNYDYKEEVTLFNNSKK